MNIGKQYRSLAPEHPTNIRQLRDHLLTFTRLVKSLLRQKKYIYTEKKEKLKNFLGHLGKHIYIENHCKNKNHRNLFPFNGSGLWGRAPRPS